MIQIVNSGKGNTNSFKLMKIFNLTNETQIKIYYAEPPFFTCKISKIPSFELKILW